MEPKLLGFADEPRAVDATRFLSSIILTSSVLTRAEWGFVRVMLCRAHLAVDVADGVVALAALWALGSSGNAAARNFFLALAAIAFLVGPLSDPEEIP